MRARRRLVAQGVGNQIAATNIALLATLLTGICCAAQAQPIAVEQVDVLASGIYELDIVRRERKDDAAFATTNTIARARLVRRTSTVPLRRCVSFGFEYVIRGGPSGAQVPMRMITRFPSPGPRNPQTAMSVQATETLVVRSIGRLHTRAYTLEQDWELVPGVWTLEIWSGDRKLAALSFELQPPCPECHGAGESKGDCARDLLSGPTLGTFRLAEGTEESRGVGMEVPARNGRARLEPYGRGSGHAWTAAADLDLSCHGPHSSCRVSGLVRER